MTNLHTAFESLKSRAPDHWHAELGVIIGSGLGSLLDQFSVKTTINYTELDGFGHSTAPGHKGCLHLATYKGSPIVIFEGRLHMYEGWTAQQAAMPVRLAKMMGVRNLLITNAVGALVSNFTPGDVMLVNDHINFTGCSPLRGENDESLGLRFPDMSQAYNQQLRAIAESAFAEQKIPLQHGIYAGVFGPELETSAERRFFRTAGCDVVGMSLVMETIAAVHCGIKVLALTAVTNSATGSADQQADSIEEVLENAAVSASKINQAIPEIVAQIIGI